MGYFNGKNNFLNYTTLKRHLLILEAHCKRIRLLKSISSSASLKASLEKKIIWLYLVLSLSVVLLSLGAH